MLSPIFTARSRAALVCAWVSCVAAGCGGSVELSRGADTDAAADSVLGEPDATRDAGGSEATPADEGPDADASADGDGVAVPSTAGSAVWLRTLASTYEDLAFDVAVGAAGSTYVLGHSVVPIEMPDGVVRSSPYSSGVFLSKLDVAGRHLWTRYLGLGNGSVNITPAGDAIVVGGTPDPSYGAPVAAALTIIALDGDGNEKWSRRFAASTMDDVAPRVRARGAIDAEGHIGFVMDAAGAIAIGSSSYGDGRGGIHTRVGGMLDATGNPLWSTALGFDVESEDRVFFAPDGRLVIGGTTRGIASLGVVSAGLTDVFATAFLPDGTLSWARSWGDDGSQYLQGLGLDADGALVLGEQSPPVGGPTSPTTARVRKVSSAGDDLWLHPLAGVTRLVIARTSSTDLLIGGTFVGELDLGAGTMTTATEASFIARLSPEGVARWSRSFGPRNSGLQRLAVDAAGVAFAGTFNNAWTLDTLALEPTDGGASSPREDVFAGRIVW